VSDDKQSDVQLNEAFERLEAQVAENQNTSPEGSSGPAKGKRPEHQPGRMNISGVLGMLLGLIALGVASFAAFTVMQMQQQDQQATTTEQLSRVSEQLAQLKQQQNQAEQRFTTVRQELVATTNANDEALQAMESRVGGVVAELKQQLGTSSEDWLLAEAEYLLRLANQRVAMEDDAAGAIKLFQAADQIIREAEGVVAFDLRQAIANDIAALRSVSNADVQGIFVELGALAGQVDRLEQKRLEYAPTEATKAVIENAEQNALDKILAFLSGIGARLATLVDYRDDGESIKPILPPEEEYYLKQNLTLKIQLAQLGLLQGNQAIYEQSLTDAISWVDQYFNPDASLTISIREGLTRLSNIEIGRNLPEVSGSLHEIRQLMNEFHKTPDRAAP
jgi:uroporphyrin-3 C-methyltransferase